MFGTLIPRRKTFLMPTIERFPGMLRGMDEEMEEMMERFFGGDGGWLTPPTGFVPKTDLVETEKEFEVTVDLPGLKPEEVNVEFKNGDLWISGKHEEEKEEKGKTYHRVERSHGEFRRVLPLPATIQKEEIDARFEGGVLKVTIPKAEEAKTTHIEVK